MPKTLVKDVIFPCARDEEEVKSIAIRGMSELGVVIFHNFYINMFDHLCHKRDVG